MRIWLMKITIVLLFLLAHQSGLQAGQRIAHLAFEFGLGRERRHRVDDDQVHRAGAHQRIDDLQGLFTGVRLRDQQFLQVHAELLGVVDVERVLGIDERADAADLLHLGRHLQRERGLAGRFRAVDLDHATARQAADAQRDVQAQRAGGHDLDVLDHLACAQAHDRALAELLLDLGQGGLQGLGLLGVQRRGLRDRGGVDGLVVGRVGVLRGVLGGGVHADSPCSVCAGWIMAISWIYVQPSGKDYSWAEARCVSQRNSNVRTLCGYATRQNTMKMTPASNHPITSRTGQESVECAF
jgi:hypothetical protein